MKKLRILSGLFAFMGLIPLGTMAQNYDTLWKEVETCIKKDLPKSVIEKANVIYEKAQTERNVPQMLKAHIVRANCQVELVPDSLEAEVAKLKEWAKTEPDLVGRAMLNCILGNMEANRKDGLDDAIRYFRLSLTDRDLLRRTPVRDYRPVTASGKLSEKYFGDNMYDTLVRLAIRSLSSMLWNSNDEYRYKSIQCAYGFFDDLIAACNPDDRTALFLCQEAKLYFQRDRMNGYARYKLSLDEFAEKMLALADAYKDVPECADAYLKVARAYSHADKWARTVEVARKGLALYPGGEWTASLNGVIACAETPTLSVSVPFVYPEYESELKVRFSNLKGVSLDLYRLNLTAASEELAKYQTDELLKRYGKKVSSQNYSLTPSADYTPTDTVFPYTLPQAGIYVLRQMPKDVKNAQAAYTVMNVSPYRFIATPVDGKNVEITAVDRLSGHPVPNAEVAVYTDRNKFVRAYTADARGSVQIPVSEFHRMNIRTAGNDYMPIESVYGGRIYASVRTNKGWTQTNRLFADRSLYRPGQTVHVSGFSFEQNGDSVRVQKNARVHLALRGNGQTLGQSDVCSDDMGAFTADFALPEALLPGNYSVSANQGSQITVRVEEYKRPTFDVLLSCTDSYVMGDTVCLQGEAKTFSGVPVRDAVVKYRFTRGVRNWWRWSLSDETTLSEEDTKTDGDGRFRVKVVLAKPEEALDDKGWAASFYDYTLSADVTSGSGETQSGTLSLPVGRQSLSVEVQLEADKIMREKNPAMQFKVLNLSRKPVDTEVTYRVCRAGKNDAPGAQVYEGTARSLRQFVPEGVWALPSGRYVLTASVRDEKNRECTGTRVFTLFSRTDTKVPQGEEAWFYADGSEFSATDVPTLYVGTAEKDVWLLVDVYSGAKRIRSECLTLSDEVRKFAFPYCAEYGDGIRVNASFLRKDQYWQTNMSVVRPRPDKQLTLKWETFRDKLRPGNREEWRMKISGAKEQPVMANVMAELYDASLDKIRPHKWNFGLWFPRPIPNANVRFSSYGGSMSLWNTFSRPFVGEGLNLIDYPQLMSLRDNPDADYSTIMGFTSGVEGRFFFPRTFAISRMERMDASLMGATMPRVQNSKVRVEADRVMLAKAPSVGENSESESGETDATVRENFAETAFFYPCLRTDSLGEVTVSFTVPDALTEWRFQSFAHTADVCYGLLTDKAVTQKQFMIQPNMPRFVRRGDRATIAATLVNMATADVKGTARIELSDPVSGKVVYRASEAFAVTQGQTGYIRFGFAVPQEHDVLVCRITASAGEYSDGEQHYLPVLTDKQWMVETVPVQLNGEGKKTVQTSKLFNGQSATATGRRLTVELTANPDWYVVQALPAMANPQNEDALAWASAYYANALAGVVVDANPRIKQVVESWKAQGGETLLSQLERNQDLKALLLKETPWVTDAESETEQQRRIATLFDPNTMESRTLTAMTKLGALQNADGSWSWYRGMQGSRVVSTQVTLMLARLKAIGATLNGKMATMYAKGLDFVASRAKQEYEDMLRWERKGKGETLDLTEQTMDYLYICAIDPQAMQKADRKVNAYFIKKLANRSADYTIYGKSRMAVIMREAGQTEQAAELVQSVKEYLVATEEMGSYFDTRKATYSWRNYRIPTQVAVMEAIYRLTPDEETLNGMKQWLLKQKQVQGWESSVATADAVYAFLCMNGNHSLNVNGQMKATWSKGSVSTPDDALGYTRQTITGADTKEPRITVSKTGKGLGWGAVYAQYFDRMDRISAYSGKGVSVTRTYQKDGKIISPESGLRVGDKVTVLLTVKADRDMDFVQIKDERAACMETADQLSGYCYAGELGYYRANHDASTEFFIDRLPKGSYRIAYDVYVDRTGTYQSGIATIQSAYSPEFGGHTSAQTLKVQE